MPLTTYTAGEVLTAASLNANFTFAAASGGVVQTVSTQTGAVATGSTVMPSDNSIPQITEGTQFLSRTITPTSATNILSIIVIM